MPTLDDQACELLAFRPMSVARRCFAAWRGLVAKRAAREHRGAWLRQRALQLPVERLQLGRVGEAAAEAGEV